MFLEALEFIASLALWSFQCMTQDILTLNTKYYTNIYILRNTISLKFKFNWVFCISAKYGNAALHKYA